MMEYVQAGDGPPVLLLHGAMGGYDQSLILGRSALGPSGFRFVAVSRPGYLGTRLDGNRTPEQQADLCNGLLDALSIPEVAVIAISGGGQCALQFALRHPERCRALVMISACSAPISVRLPLGYHLMKLAARVPALAAGMRKKAAHAPLPAEIATPEAAGLMRELQLSTLDRMGDRMSGTQNDIQQSRRRFSYPFESIHTPALVIHGTADEAAPFAHSEALAGRLPNAEFLAIEGARHIALFTHLDLIRQKVRGFLQ
jgi:pimeloyl-ACP methyl ester carboxylesterase